VLLGAVNLIGWAMMEIVEVTGFVLHIIIVGCHIYIFAIRELSLIALDGPTRGYCKAKWFGGRSMGNGLFIYRVGKGQIEFS
jgi:hypothetical protein